MATENSWVRRDSNVMKCDSNGHITRKFIMNYMKICAQDIYSKLPMIVIIVVSALDYSKLVPLASGKENSELTLLSCGKKV